MELKTVSCFQPNDSLGGAEQQLAFGKVTVYEAGTSTPASIFDFDGNALNNPFTADANGLGEFRAADGKYDIQITSADGSTYIAPLLREVQFSDEFTDPSFTSAVITGGDPSGDTGVPPLGQIKNRLGIFIDKGDWNASTNSPTLVSGAGTKGWFYRVSTAGTTNLDGIATWNAGDLAYFHTSTWQRIIGPASLAALGAIIYQGIWNANTNSPSLASGTGTKGAYYTVSTAGTTSLDGIAVWKVGDKAVYNGTAWEKIDGITNEVTSVSGRTGDVTAPQLVGDIFLNSNSANAIAEVSLASASTLDLTVATSPFVFVTGTATINTITAPANSLFFLRFEGALTLTHNSTSLICPGGKSIVTAAGDCAIAKTDVSSNVRVRHFQRAAQGIDQPAKNYLINPCFDVWQEATSYASTGTTGTQYFIADGWKAKHNSSNQRTVSRAAGWNGARYSLQVQRNSGSSTTTAESVGQQFSTEESDYLAGKAVTLSFDWQTGADWTVTTLNFAILTGTGTDENCDLSTGFSTGGVSTAFGAGTFAANSSGSYSASLTVPSSITEAALKLFTGSYSGTAGTNDWIRITNVKLEIGAGKTAFERPLIADVMAHCLRQYQKSFLQATAPAQNAGAGTGERIFIAGKAAATAQLVTVNLKGVMRTTPTVTLYNPAAANAQVRDETAAADCSSSTATNITEGSFEITCTGNGSTAVGNALGVHWTADARR